MGYGLFLENGTNDVLIDNKGVHPKLIHTQMVTLPANIVGRPFTVTLPTPTTRPIIATGFSEVTSFSLAGVVFDGTYYRGIKGAACWGTAGETITVRVYEL